MAEKLVITTNTVKRHLKAIFEKLNFHTRSAATAKVARDIKIGIIGIPLATLRDDVNVRPKAGATAKHPSSRIAKHPC